MPVCEMIGQEQVMSQPPAGPDPNPQQGYENSGYQQSGQQQPYGSAPASHSGHGQPATADRPALVLTAAILAFVIGGLGILLNLLALTVAFEFGAFVGLLVLVSVVVSAAFIWGGLQAMKGKDQRTLVIVAAASIVLNLLVAVIYTFTISTVLSMIIPIAIIALLMAPQSKQWFAAKGAPTF